MTIFNRQGILIAVVLLSVLLSQQVLMPVAFGQSKDSLADQAEALEGARLSPGSTDHDGDALGNVAPLWMATTTAPSWIVEANEGQAPGESPEYILPTEDEMRGGGDINWLVVTGIVVGILALATILTFTVE